MALVEVIALNLHPENALGLIVVTELGISKENIVGNIKLIALVDWCEEHNYARGLIKLIDMTDKVDLKS